MWCDIAMIVFSATLANHMGLISAIEKVIRHKIPIVNCVRCCAYWCTLAYTLISRIPVIHAIAISFAAAYVAVWFELSLGLIDNLYYGIYKDSFAADTKAEDTKANNAEYTETTVS